MKKVFYISIYLLMAIIATSCKNIITDPKTLIEKYLSSKTLQERCQYVYDTARVKSVMESYYQKTDFSSPIRLGNIKQLPYSFNSNISDSVMLMNVVIFGKNVFGKEVSDTYEYYILNMGNEGLKIDWFSSIGYNKLSLNTFQAISPSDINVFRLNCKISDYYYYGYIDLKDKYYSIECNSELDNSNINGYIDKKSEDGRKLFEILKDGNPHKLVLALKYDYKSERSSDIAAIKKLVAIGWYYNDKIEKTFSESLSDYILYLNMDTTFKYKMTNGTSTDDAFTFIIKRNFDKDVLVINTQSWFQGRVAAENIEYCTLDDSALTVNKVENSNVLTGHFVRNEHIILVKLPSESKATLWDYKDPDGIMYSCSSEFTSINFNGYNTKAIKVTEKCSFFPHSTYYRFFLKGFGLYEESYVENGKKFYLKQLVK